MSRTVRHDPADRDSAFPAVRTFARRGDRMGQTLERSFEKYRDAYVLEVARGATPTMAAPEARLDLREVFGREAPLVVEVGCGNGEQLTHAAAQNPEVNFLGFEVWLPGVAKTVSAAARTYAGLKNLRIADLDAVQALPILLAPGSVAQLWTFFADPWPKTRHRKRRLVTPDFANLVVNLLVEGGQWRLATDWADYAWQMREVIESTPGLENVYAGQHPDAADPYPERGGFAPRFEGRIHTAFERRAAREGRVVRDLCARKVAAASDATGLSEYQ